jgi:carboxymethylenebutenolidase
MLSRHEHVIEPRVGRFDHCTAGIHQEPSMSVTRPARRLVVIRRLIATVAGLSLVSCARRTAEGDTHAGHDAGSAVAASARTTAASTSDAIPAGATTVADRIARSTRHGEYVMIGAGPDSVRAWVVYPERATRAPVVVVVHEIFGLSTWVRGVADQLAADGFIAIAPDLLTGKVAPVPGSDTVASSAATAAIRSLASSDVQRQIAAVGRYGMSLPAAAKSYGVVGFCWGGSASFASAVASPSGQGAAVVYYGSAPAPATLSPIRIPVLGLYGGEDARIGATVPATDSAMKALGKSFVHHTFPGAGHGFLRQQDGQGGANLTAARQAWPLTVSFFRTNLGR